MSHRHNNMILDTGIRDYNNYPIRKMERKMTRKNVN